MNRENMLGKIRALMAKTVEAGCTEGEAMAALAKARAMMDAYEVTEADLNLSKEEKAVLRKEPPGSRDAHKIKAMMAKAIAQFTDTKVWRGTDGLVYCGLRSDVQFASWLTDSLNTFVLGELTRHLAESLEAPGERRLIINGFVIGCCNRISARIAELCANSQTVAAANSRALVVVKSGAIAAKMKEMGITLGKSRGSRRQYDEGALAAGRAAGDRANFGRPVSGSNGTLRLK
jgi:hypothetical protein